MDTSKAIKDLRKFYIEALTNAGYYEKDLKLMNTHKLTELYYQELKNNVKRVITEFKN